MNRTTQAAVAATQPLALAAIAEHMVTHHLPAAVDINVPGNLVGETTDPVVQIILDNPYVAVWIDSLDSVTRTDVTAHSGGTWHDTWGVANSIRVRLSHYTLRVTDHTECVDPDCDQVLCYDDPACTGVARPGCDHVGAFVCNEHLSSCTDCSVEMAANRRPGVRL